jgi:hypothetical protein
VYRPQLFPDVRRTLELWRNEARSYGFNDLYLGYVQSFGFKEAPEKYGFDCAVEFQPDFSRLPPRLEPGLKERIHAKLFKSTSVYDLNKIVSYKDFVENIMKTDKLDPKVYKAVCPMWDNSPRRQKGALVFKDSTPELYEKWLRHVVSLTSQSQQKDKFIFINAWNEWAEGNHLEPCQKWGHQYLQANKNALSHA